MDNFGNIRLARQKTCEIILCIPGHGNESVAARKSFEDQALILGSGPTGGILRVFAPRGLERQEIMAVNHVRQMRHKGNPHSEGLVGEYKQGVLRLLIGLFPQLPRIK